MSKSILLAIDVSSGGAHALQHILAFTDSASVKVVLAYVIDGHPIHSIRQKKMPNAKNAVKAKFPGLRPLWSIQHKTN